MRIRVRVFALVVIAVGLGFSPRGAGADVPTAVDSGLTVHSVTLSRASVAVSGLNVVPVQVHVSASHPAADVPLSVLFERTADGGSLRSLAASNLPRVSGTGGTGVWSGTLRVPSTAGGEWKVTAVLAGLNLPESPVMTDPTPFDGPTLSVTGLHQPRITLTTYPNPVPLGSAYAVGGKVVDSATGLAYGTQIPVEIGVDNFCVEYTRPVVRSTTAGTFAYRLPASAAEWVNCAILTNGGTYITSVTISPARPGWVGALPTAVTGPVGTFVTVHGKSNAAFCAVQLQRLRGDSQWRTVAVSRVRESGRITLLAPLAEAGRLIFRAYLPTCTSFGAAAGRPFLVRAS